MNEFCFLCIFSGILNLFEMLILNWSSFLPEMHLQKWQRILSTYDNELHRNQRSRRKLDAQILENKLILKAGLTD